MKQLHTSSVLFLFILAFSFLPAPQGYAEPDLEFIVIKYTNYDRKTIYKIVAKEKYAAYQKELKLEAKYFSKALTSAKKEWVKAGHKAFSFPALITKRQIQTASSTYNDINPAMEKQKLLEEKAKSRSKDKMEEMLVEWRNKIYAAQGNLKPSVNLKYSAKLRGLIEKDINTKNACSILVEKLNLLVSAANSEDANIFSYENAKYPYIVPGKESGNIAGEATATDSDQTPDALYRPENAIDRIVDAHPNPWSPLFEWAPTNTIGGKIRLTWKRPKTIDRILLYDKGDTFSNITVGQLVFSDDTTIDTGALPNDALKGLEVKFEPKTVAWLEFVIKATTGYPGLSEIMVYEVKPD